MGPRPDGRGTRARRQGPPPPQTASMGPRPDGRGTIKKCMLHRRRLSFNGAATGWPRNVRADLWVGDPLGASMGPRPDGRGTSGARARSQFAGPASMGPRPDGRGTHVFGQFSPSDSRLQWGRDRMAAERRSCPAGALGGICFNGAATGWPRNVQMLQYAEDECKALQWGRDRMAAERG